VEWRLDHGAEVVTIEPGDVLVVTRLDLLRIVDQIAKEGAGFKSFGEPWADTTSSADPAANQ
jgi:hypothetical protein